MQQREIVATRTGAGGRCEVDDWGVRLGQRCLAQKKFGREAFDAAFDEAVGVVSVDFAIDLDAQFVERALGRERMNDVAERMLMMMQQTIFGQVDPPGQDMLSLMVAWRETQQLRHAGRRRVIAVGRRVRDVYPHNKVRLKTWMAGTSPAMTKSDCKVSSGIKSGNLFVGHDEWRLMSGIAR